MKSASKFETSLLVARTALTLGALTIAPIAYAQDAATMPAPPLGGIGGAIDKSDDAVLQAMIEAVVPTFTQGEYIDEQIGLSVPYNIYLP